MEQVQVKTEINVKVIAVNPMQWFQNRHFTKADKLKCYLFSERLYVQR